MKQIATPQTGFGFKRLFGTEINKELPVRSLNALLTGEQAKRGDDCDFHLNAVYTVGLPKFVSDEDKSPPDCYHHEAKLMDVERKTVFYDKLAFIYIEIPKFNKSEA